MKLVQNIQELQPLSTVVVNGILPRDRLLFQEKIEWINTWFACHYDYVYDPSSVFINDEGNDVDRMRMPDGLHPSALGYLAWGREVVEKVKQIQDEDVLVQSTP